MSTSKLQYISNLRIVCTFLVIFGHSYPFDVNIPSVLLDIRTLIYIFHMPLFVLISGYLTTYLKSIEKHGSVVYLKKRIIKLIIPYLALSILFYIPKSFLDSSTELSVNAFLESIVIPRSNVWGHFWFLPMLIIFTVISIFVYKIINHKMHYAVILCIISFLLVFLPNQTGLLGLNDVRNNLCWYLTGMLLGELKNKSPLNLKMKLNMTAVCLILLIFMFFNFSSGHFNTLIKILITFFMCYGLYLVLYNCDMCKNKFFNFVNKYSFSLFILSWPFQSIIEIVINKILGLPVGVSMMSMFTGGIILPILTIKIFKFLSHKLSATKLNHIFKAAGVMIGLN